jgi:hypothetical protein
MMAFLMGLCKHWKAGAIVSIVSGVSATIYFQHLDIDHQKHLLVAARAQYALLEQSNLALEGAIDRQNAAVTALVAQGQVKEQRAAAALAQANLAAARYRKNAQALKASGNSCKELRAAINSYAAMAAKEGF